MSQIKPILNPNSNFEFGDTTGFTEALTGVTGSFLDRQDERSNEKRQVFPPLMKSRSDYIFNGRFSRRYTLAAGGDFTLTMDSVPVEPGMIISTVIAYRIDSSPDSATPTISLDGLLDDATDIFAVRDLGEAATRFIIGNQFNYTWDATVAPIVLGNSNAVPQDLWYRAGFTTEIAQGVVSMSPVFAFAGAAAAVQVLDVGEFSMQALDSRIHAGG